MGALSFDGVDDDVRSSSLSTALANTSNGAWTVAALIRRGSATTFDAVTYLHTNPSTEAGFTIDSADDLVVDISGIGTCTSAQTITNTTDPYLIVVAKGDGNVSPVFSLKLGSGGSWTSGTMSGTMANQATATHLVIGKWETGDPFIGHIGVIAWWEGAMSQTDREALDNNWRTSDMWNSAHGQPTSLIELNTTTPTDLGAGGGAASLAVTGATLDGAQTLNSWNFDGVGGAVADIAYLAMAPPVPA